MACYTYKNNKYQGREELESFLIEEAIQFQKELSQKGIQPIVNGFVHNDVVYLNKDTMGVDTPIHEFGHLYLKALKNSNPELYKEGLKKVNSKEAKEYIDYVKTTQPELKEGTEAFNEEVLAQAIGDNGARLINTNKKNSLKEWLNDFWEFIKGKLGLSQYSIEEVQNMTLGEYAEAVSVDLLSGNNLDKGEAFDNSSLQTISYESNDIRYQKQNNSLSLPSYISTLSVDKLNALGGENAILEQYEKVAAFQTEEEFIETLNCKL